jgi:uncharacterized protein YdhG (YjbR/CyaY superfamily)
LLYHKEDFTSRNWNCGGLLLIKQNFILMVENTLKVIGFGEYEQFKTNVKMEILKSLPTELLKKMLEEIKDNITLAFIRAEFLDRGEL